MAAQDHPKNEPDHFVVLWAPTENEPDFIIVSVLTDPQQSWLAFGRVLTRYQAQPGRQITPAAELARTANRQHLRRCREQPQAWEDPLTRMTP